MPILLKLIQTDSKAAAKKTKYMMGTSYHLQ